MIADIIKQKFFNQIMCQINKVWRPFTLFMDGGKLSLAYTGLLTYVNCFFLRSMIKGIFLLLIFASGFFSSPEIEILDMALLNNFLGAF